MTPDASQAEVERLLPHRRGHFAYESGHHGDVWLDLERLFLHPDRVRPLAEMLARRLRPHQIDIVCGALVEGAFLGLMVATELAVPFTYSTPAADEDGAELFPISYPIPLALQSELRGKRVAVVNDVVNAGSAVRGTLAALKHCGAHPVAVGTLAVFGQAASELARTELVILETLATLENQRWDPFECPLCEQRVPLERRGGHLPSN